MAAALFAAVHLTALGTCALGPRAHVGAHVQRPGWELRRPVRPPCTELPRLCAEPPSAKQRRLVRQIPNALSLSRIGFIPAICAIWLSPSPSRSVVCASLFGVATLTDGLDGYLARRLDACSRFGAFLDPVTDKLLVCTCLVLLVATGASALVVSCALVAVAREIAVSALREWMAQSGQRDKVRVGLLGKCKTASQLVAIWLLFATPALEARPAVHALATQVAPPLLALSTALSTLSMVQYFVAARESLSDSDE